MRSLTLPLLGIALMLGNIGLAQEPQTRPTTEAVAPIDHKDVQRWAAAWNSHDIDTVLALFDRNVVIHQPSNPKPLDFNGSRGFFAMIFKAYPDFRVEVTDAVVEGHTAVSIERVTGSWSGPFTDPATGQTSPGNGRHFDHPGVMVIKYGADHKIQNVDIYWDRLVVDQQLGITP
jgi:steroid delta-isomerase-like uncharacterized protein